uniref:tetratricopeptide repeat protein n=1 Tax=Flavobacterium sp. TaxID=239 RepID=UPI00404A1D61
MSKKKYSKKMNENKKLFASKIIDVVFTILLIRIIYSLFFVFYISIGEFVLLLLTSIGFSLLLYYSLKKVSNGDGFSGFWSNSNGSGSSVLLHSSVFDQIEQKYRNLAQEYIKQKEYKKAAHIYMKLLKDNYEAAEVLYDGELYMEAATVNLKYLKNERKAALCFEKAKAYKEALNLYLKLDEHEKVGDMYVQLNEVNKAKIAYYRKKDQLMVSGQYLDASKLSRTKLKLPNEAQRILLEGWDKNIEAKECLHAYFQNLDQDSDLETEMQTIYETKTSDSKVKFLQVIKYQFGKDVSVNKKIRNISYEIVSHLVQKNPNIISELNYLNVQNTTFAKDVLKYKLKGSGKL